MSCCAVSTCKNYYNSRKTRHQDIAYHRFPSDPNLQRLWIQKCMRNDTIRLDTARICSQHFLKEDYERNLMAELMNSNKRKILKANAVPSQNLPSQLNQLPFDISENKKYEYPVEEIMHVYELTNPTEMEMSKANEVPSQNLPSILNQLPFNASKDTKHECTFEEIMHASPCVLYSQTEDLCSSKNITRETNTSVGDDYVKQLEDKILYLETRITNLAIANKRLLSLNKSLRSQSTLQRSSRIRRNKRFHEKLRGKFKEVFKNMISDRQIDCLITKKCCKEWNEEEMCKAICLRSISKSGYLLLRQKLDFPLPSISTLERWVNSSFKCQPGILLDILKLMEAKSHLLSDSEKICLLSFDEMCVDNRVSYDKAEDRILSPQNSVQVVMLRGLFSSWQQPIFYGFDVTMTKGLLFEIILAVENASFKVAGIVSDLEQNRSLWMSLKINHENPSFLNPANNKKSIWVFGSVTHLLKKLRNNFLDHSLTIQNKHCVEKSVIEKLFYVSSKLCPELTLYHINVQDKERQRLDLATQLFSSQTAKAIKFFMPEEEATCILFQRTSDFLDIMNFGDNNTTLASHGFGSNIDSQEDTLNKFYNLIIDLRVGKLKKMQLFQKGFLQTINALRGLYADMKHIGNILTSRLNLDCLEIYFSRLRELGQSYDYLLPSEVISRMHILLRNTVTEFSSISGSSVQINNASNFLSSDMLNPLLPRKTEHYFYEYLRDDSNIIAIKEDFTTENLENLARYIEFKCNKDDDLVNSVVTVKSEFDDSPVRWIKNIYQGSLLISSAQWFQLIEEFELVFNELHGRRGLSREKGIVKKLCSILTEKYPAVSMEVIKCFAEMRTFIQIRCLNQQLKPSKS